jgi:hypothetical protein
MTESRIEQLAEAILAERGLLDPPIDPFALARHEGIRLAPGQYDNCFDGRIEYRRTRRGDRFFVFYAEEAPPLRPASRVRYSVSHELGHYFLPAHREYLLSGDWHGSQTEFLCARRPEREADWFAAALLMPRASFIAQVQKVRGHCGLTELARLANCVFHTSLTSTAIRFAQLNFAACCVVLSECGRMRFGVMSEEMKRCSLGWLGHIPKQSVTGQVSAARRNGRRVKTSGLVKADVWFPEAPPAQELWEEAKVLGQTGRTLTFLLAPDVATGEQAGA